MFVFIDPLTDPAPVMPRDVKPGHFVWRCRVDGSDGDWYEVIEVKWLSNSRYRVRADVPEDRRHLVKPTRLHRPADRVEIRYRKESRT